MCQGCSHHLFISEPMTCRRPEFSEFSEIRYDDMVEKFAILSLSVCHVIPYIQHIKQLDTIHHTITSATASYS